MLYEIMISCGEKPEISTKDLDFGEAVKDFGIGVIGIYLMRYLAGTEVIKKKNSFFKSQKSAIRII